MSREILLELPVTLRLQRLRRANPFHWALLRALQLFPAGKRPPLEEFVGRLCLGEKTFLEEAWRELLEFHAVDDPDFQQAGLSMEGREALAKGWFPLGAAVEQVRFLCFRSDGECVESYGRSRAPRGEPAAVSMELRQVLSDPRVQSIVEDELGRGATPAQETCVGARVQWDVAKLV